MLINSKSKIVNCYRRSMVLFNDFTVVLVPQRGRPDVTSRHPDTCQAGTSLAAGLRDSNSDVNADADLILQGHLHVLSCEKVCTLDVLK
jgi:hypothetical protein